MTKSPQKNKMADSPITNSKGDIRRIIVPTEETFIFHGKSGSFYNHHHRFSDDSSANTKFPTKLKLRWKRISWIIFGGSYFLLQDISDSF